MNRLLLYIIMVFFKMVFIDFQYGVHFTVYQKVREQEQLNRKFADIYQEINGFPVSIVPGFNQSSDQPCFFS